MRRATILQMLMRKFLTASVGTPNKSIKFMEVYDDLAVILIAQKLDGLHSLSSD